MRYLLIGCSSFLLALATTACHRLPDEGPMPELSGGSTWLNSPPLTTAGLRGKVVLIDFWTYSCVNCLRAIPYVKAWEAKYRDKGLVVIGVHAPEFDFEHDVENVNRAANRLGITYPIVLDTGMQIWNAFRNQYWPAHYFIDAKGRIRHHHFGEGGYEESEQVIRTLLADANPSSVSLGEDTTKYVTANGALASRTGTHPISPETYLGYARSKGLASPELIRRDVVASYTSPAKLTANQWAFAGAWRVTREYSEATTAGASITYQFRGRDVNLVLGTGTPNTPIKFRITIDGKPPGNDAGADVDAQGNGVITDHRMYQLIRQRTVGEPRTFMITFETPGAQAYAFTFG